MSHIPTINLPGPDRPPPTASRQPDTPARTWRQASNNRHDGSDPPSEQEALTPLVIDTDAGYDPDDVMALTIAALHVPELALVTTCDEHDRQRGRLVRTLLDLCGRPDVPVISGAELPGAQARFLAASLITNQHTQTSGDLAAALAAIADATGGPIRWVGLGPMSNLAALTRTRPELVSQLRVWQMGGAMNYRDPNRAEHNIRLDVAAARQVLHAVPHLHLVTSDVTFTPELEITPQSPIYRRWCRPGVPRWAQFLRTHLQQWISGTGHPGSMAHDPLTLAAALGEPLIKYETGYVALDEIGRMRPDPHGYQVDYSHSADYPATREWLSTLLNPWPNER